MFYDATHLIMPGGSTESQQTALVGSAALIGFVASNILDLFISAVFGNADDDAPGANGETNGETNGKLGLEGGAEVAEVSPSRSRRVLTGILLGDFMHNLVDGIFIGFAFYQCDKAKGWGITGATIAHEVAQELADYLVLTDKYQGGLKPFRALLYNFISGLNVTLGAIIVLAQGFEDNLSMGMLLAFGGGIYVQIGAAECMPRAVEFAKTVILRSVALLTLIVGAAAIGIVLISHEHCAPDGGDGHAH